MLRFLSLTALLLGAFAIFPAQARDDGGFGSGGFTGGAPTAFSDPSPQALARYQAPPSDSSVADIEPAAGDEADDDTAQGTTPVQDSSENPVDTAKDMGAAAQ